MLIAAALALQLATQAPPETATVSPVTVVSTPLGASQDRLQTPSLAQSVTGTQFQRSGTLSTLDGLEQRLPGVFLSDVNGNAADRTLDFHGFSASSTPGAAQGLAVYLGAVRLNEAFGDTVNWDLIPQVAIDRADVLTGDPAFGLNALGGAAALAMKSGETFSGVEATVRGGSFGRAEGSAQVGARDGDLSVYLAGDGGREDGWRLRSPSRQARLYGDLGWRHGALEAHLIGAGSATFLGVVGPTPVDLLSADRRAVFTSPQATRNDDALVASTLKWSAGSGWTLKGDAHVRTFNQAHTDGNDADLEGCGGALRGTLCLEDDAFPRAIRPAASAFQLRDAANRTIECPPLVPGQTRPCAGVPYGTVDRTRTDATTVGGSFEATYDRALLSRDNQLILGASRDESRFTFSAQSELGYIDSDLVVGGRAGVPGLGSVIHTTGLIGYAPVSLSGRRTDDGLYVSDRLSLTDRLTLTLGGRYNAVDIRTLDRAGTSPELTGAHRFTRFNPQVGLAFRVAPKAALYASYSEANRAPTPLELSCSDPNRPCLLENALVADPPLKQVTGRTVEVGAKGSATLYGARLGFSLSAYDTRVDDDIIPLASVIAGRGYYANVPGTQRRGIDLGLDATRGPITAYLGYAYVEATYRFSGALASPNSPSADASGNIQVEPGDRLGGVPRHRFKAGADWRVNDRLTVGADVLATGSQPFVGDESNSEAALPAWWTTAVRADWRFTDRLTATLQVRNLFDRDYATYGTYFDGGGVATAGSALPASPDPRTITPAEPRSFRLGLTARW
ncbi:TonB-dependent receptor [soil metagenome]